MGRYSLAIVINSDVLGDDVLLSHSVVDASVTSAKPKYLDVLIDVTCIGCGIRV